MSEHQETLAILLADVTGSSPLYRSAGDVEALRQVQACLDRLRAIIAAEGGEFIHSRGDDALCVFADAASGLRAARRMLDEGPGGSIALHAGLHWGPVIRARDDIFGDAVNLTARLAAQSNPGETLVSGALAARLGEAHRDQLRPMRQMAFKGMSEPIEVFALLEAGPEDHTRLAAPPPDPGGDAAVELSFGERRWTARAGRAVSLGRAAECDVVIAERWISRRHGEVGARRGLTEFVDRSSTGSFVTIGPRQEVFVRRQTVLLTGSGLISLGVPAASGEARVIRFEVAGADD